MNPPRALPLPLILAVACGNGNPATPIPDAATAPAAPADAGATEARPVETAAERQVARDELAPPDDGALHVLESGQTLWDLTRIYDVTLDALMERNDLGDSEARQLRAGQHIVIPGITAEAASRRAEGSAVLVPGAKPGRAGAAVKRQSPASRRAEAVARRLGLGTRKAASALLSGNVEPRWVAAAGGKAGRLPGHLRWPVANGWFVRGFGSGASGYHLAVDIAGEIGWNVRAAAPGLVGYSGDEVKGYGNLVLVIHPGGWITLYAHNSVNFVAAGQKVTRGQILAELGSTGISRGPHVHFELIFRGQLCDPALLFKPGIRHRSGRLSPLGYTTWTDPDARPRGVECRPRCKHPGAATVETEAAELDPAALVPDPAP